MYVIIYIKLEHNRLIYHFDSSHGSILLDETYVKNIIGDANEADVITDDGMLMRTRPSILFTDDHVSCIAILGKGVTGTQTHLIIEIKEGYENRFDLIYKYVSLSDESRNNILTKIKTELRDKLIDKLI